MGTRGAIGFRMGGKDYITYNHFDSYPDDLGQRVVDWVKGVKDWGAVRAKVKGLRIVDETEAVDPASLLMLKKMKLWRQVSSGTDWYAALRNCQGDLQAYLDLGVMPDSARFMADSLFCEYAYIVNLDEMVLEFYRGFNKDPMAPGRYAALGEDGDGYRGVALVGTVELDAIPEDWTALYTKLETDNG